MSGETTNFLVKLQTTGKHDLNLLREAYE